MGQARRHLFSELFNIVAADSSTLLAQLILRQEGGDKVVFGEPAGNPIPDPYEVLLGQGVVKQLLLHLGDEEGVCWCQARVLGGMLKQQDFLDDQLIVDNGVGLHTGIVPAEEPFTGGHLSPLLFEF